MLSWTYVRNIGDLKGCVGEPAKASQGKKCANWILMDEWEFAWQMKKGLALQLADVARAKVPTLKQHLCHRNLLAPSESPGGVHIPTEAKNKTKQNRKTTKKRKKGCGY